MFRLSSTLRNAFFAIVLGATSAILFNLAFPGGSFPWLAWVAMIPVMFLLVNRRHRLACLGWASYGIFFWTGAIYWLYVYLTFVLLISKPLAICLLLICIIISAFPYIVTGYIAVRWKLFDGFLGPLKIAALLTAFVALWPVPFPGDLSMSFYRIPILIQIADIGGGPLIHFVIILVNGLILKGILSLRYKKFIPTYVWMSLAGIFLSIVTYGYLRLNQYENLYQEAPVSEFVRIGYVQTNLPGTDLSSLFGEYILSDEKSNDFISAVVLTNKLVKKEKNFDLIAWPETPEDIPYHREWVKNAIGNLVNKANGSAFVFVTMYPWSGLSKKPYMDGRNTLYLIKDGKVTYPYHKIKLIPFAEYLPGENKFSFLRNIFPLVGQITPGESTDYISLSKKLRLIPLICYDGIFPDFVRKFAMKGGNVFLALDSDTNFGPTKASEVHASVMLYRAIENRIPLVRLSNSGPSLTVLSSGQILPGSEITMYTKGFRAVNILPGGIDVTIYQRVGWCFAYILIVLLMLILFFESRFS